MLYFVGVKAYRIQNKQQYGVARHGFTCRGQCQGWEEKRQKCFFCSLVYLAYLADSTIPITIAVVCHTEGSSYPGESSKVNKASRKFPLLLALISRITSMSTQQGVFDMLKRKQWFEVTLVCNELSMFFPAPGPSCISQSQFSTSPPSLAPCSQPSEGRDPRSGRCQAFPAQQRTWKRKHLPHLRSRLVLFWRISCELVSAPASRSPSVIFWDEIRVTMRELEMDHNCLTSADNTASGSPREQVLPDIRASHSPEVAVYQLSGKGGNWLCTDRAEGQFLGSHSMAGASKYTVWISWKKK